MNYQLNEKQYDQFKLGLNDCFINKDENVKKYIAANMEPIAYIASEMVDQTGLENLHQFFPSYTNIFAKNVISTEDHTYKELKTLTHNKDIVILKVYKDSSIVIMNKADYITKIETMIEEGIKDGTYTETDDTTMQDHKRFQNFFMPQVINRRKCMARGRSILWY